MFAFLYHLSVSFFEPNDSSNDILVYFREPQNIILLLKFSLFDCDNSLQFKNKKKLLIITVFFNILLGDGLIFLGEAAY